MLRPDRSRCLDFDTGYEDAMAGRPERPTSTEYLRGYATGQRFAACVAETRARRAPCVLPLETEEQLLAEIGPPGALVGHTRRKKVRDA